MKTVMRTETDVSRERIIAKVASTFDEIGMIQKIKNFRDLDIWILGKEIVIEIYGATKGFPKEELFGLVIQMRRAAVSI